MNHSRLLVLTRNLPPLTGGMERLLLECCKALAEDHELMVVGPKGCSQHLPEGTNCHEVPIRPLAQFLFRATLASRAWCRTHRPKIILSGSGLTALPALLARTNPNTRVVSWLHGLDLLAPSWLYQQLFVRAIPRCDLLLANSAFTARLAQERGIPTERIQILHPGTEVPAPDTLDPEVFRRQFDLAGRRLLLSVGRLTPRKGLVPFIRNCLPEIVRAVPDACLVIVGADAGHALNQTQGGSMADIQAAANHAGVAGHVRFLGRLPDEILHRAYAAADIHIFPVQESLGDVEGFGMVAIEAAACGLPTVAFAVGGVPDAVRDGVSGWLLAPEDYPGFANRIIEFLRLPKARESIFPHCLGHARTFEWGVFRDKLRNSINVIVNE